MKFRQPLVKYLPQISLFFSALALLPNVTQGQFESGFFNGNAVEKLSKPPQHFPFWGHIKHRAIKPDRTPVGEILPVPTPVLFA